MSQEETESQLIREFYEQHKAGPLPVKTCRCGNCTSIACLDPNKQCDFCNGNMSVSDVKEMMRKDPKLNLRIRLPEDNSKKWRCIIM